MKRALILLLGIVLLSFSAGLGQATDPMSDKEASPTLKERITNDTVKGTLMKVEGEFYSIKDDDGNVTKIHVDKRTKMDKVVIGNKVKAYITDKGHTTTLQHAD